MGLPPATSLTCVGFIVRHGYDNDWRKLRKYKLKLTPECEDCLREGRIWPATEVHHILKIADRPDLRLDQENLMSLCKSCHGRRTGRGE